MKPRPASRPKPTSAKAPLPQKAAAGRELAAKPDTNIDDFGKVDLRVAEVKLAERVPKSDKLLRLEVDLGPLGARQILAGIGKHYAPEDARGQAHGGARQPAAAQDDGPRVAGHGARRRRRRRALGAASRRSDVPLGSTIA